MAPGIGDAAAQVVDAALDFSPAPGGDFSAGLSALPTAELPLSLVVSLGVFPNLALGVGGRGVDAGVGSALLDAGVRVGFFLRRFLGDGNACGHEEAGAVAFDEAAGRGVWAAVGAVELACCVAAWC